MARRSDERPTELKERALKRPFTTMTPQELDVSVLSLILSSMKLSPDSPNRLLLDVQAQDRTCVQEHLITLLRQCRPNAPLHLVRRLPLLAQKLDKILYQLACSKEDYMDESTLHRRLLAIGEAYENPAADDGPPPLFKLFSDGLSRIDRIADNSGFAFTALDVIEKELGGLEPIKDFRHVRFVNVAKNKLSDATPLNALEFLLVLNLSENQFTTLPKLKNPHLKALDIGKNQLSSLVDGEATKLESLKVNGNQITSLEGIAAFACLTTLDVSQNLIADMTIAAEVPSLEHLIISENQLTTLNGIHLFPNLVSFKAELNQIAALLDVQALANLTKLVEIDLTGNPLTQVDNYRLDMILLMPKLMKLDGIVIDDEERIKAIALKQERDAAAQEPSD